jgi:flagellar biogenesis protein FliO
MHSLIALKVPSVSSTAFCLLCLGAILTLPSQCVAQDLQTTSTQQSKFYGQWSPPSQPTNPGIDETRDRFRELFPPTVKPDNQTTNNQSANNRTASRYPLPQQPAPIAKELTRARPLQPQGQSNFLQGSFLQPAKQGGEFARVNHHEASTAEAAMPLPNARQLSANWPNDAPLISGDVPLNSESSSLAGMVDSVQSGGNDLWQKFQSNGGWGEKIAGFFGGDNDRFKKVFGSLGIIVGGYLAFVAFLRKFDFKGNRGIPSEVIEVVGNAPFGPRKNLQLVRLGSKLLLLMNSPEGTHPVGEITDPQEVDYLISLCNGKGSKAPRSVMSAVRQLDQRISTPARVPGRTLHPTSPPPTETTFSASQLVQALESIKNSNRSGTVFEA